MQNSKVFFLILGLALAAFGLASCQLVGETGSLSNGYVLNDTNSNIGQAASNYYSSAANTSIAPPINLNVTESQSPRSLQISFDRVAGAAYYQVWMLSGATCFNDGNNYTTNFTAAQVYETLGGSLVNYLTADANAVKYAYVTSYIIHNYYCFRVKSCNASQQCYSLSSNKLIYTNW